MTNSQKMVACLFLLLAWITILPLIYHLGSRVRRVHYQLLDDQERRHSFDVEFTNVSFISVRGGQETEYHKKVRCPEISRNGPSTGTAVSVFSGGCDRRMAGLETRYHKKDVSSFSVANCLVGREISRNGPSTGSVRKASISHDQPVLCSAWKDNGNAVSVFHELKECRSEH